ncbi:DUF2535 family protein [Bacillus sp. FJAT-45350]|uniref:DUF2535 family protein n=1 Tax=Bacillus sp. FJAT-45350 TaxID=2011014 RepID=UPI0015C69B24|nr:DUF2535 family protein [Bacillus sp. FJAT-45350]
MNTKQIEFYQVSGRKIIIHDIPIVSDEDEHFKLTWNIEKLIDEIEQSITPKDTYSYQEAITRWNTIKK